MDKYNSLWANDLIRKSLIGVAAVGSIFASTYAYNRIEYPFYDLLGQFYSDVLQANTSNFLRTVVEGKCRNEGIKDLAHLAKTSLYEEAYILFTKRCRWEEIGYSETPFNKVGMGLQLDSKHIETSFNSKEDIIIYHIHPTITVMEFLKSHPKLSDEEKAKVKVDVSTPSLGDIMTTFPLFLKFYEKNPAGKISHEIVGPYGLISILPDENKGYSLTLSDYTKNISGTLGIESNIRLAVEEMNRKAKHVTFKFTSFSELGIIPLE